VANYENANARLRALRIALSDAQRAFEDRDVGAFATVNESLQPVAAAVAWIVELRGERDRGRAELERVRRELRDALRERDEAQAERLAVRKAVYLTDKETTAEVIEHIEILWKDSVDRVLKRVATALAEGEKTTEARKEAERLREELWNAQAQREAYKRAKEENDERFQIERDEARKELRDCRRSGTELVTAGQDLYDLVGELTTTKASEAVERWFEVAQDWCTPRASGAEKEDDDGV
jgi:hypothetical protein